MKKKNWARILRWIGTILAFGLLLYLLSQQGWDEILTSVQQIAPWRFAAAALLMIISRLAVSGRWHLLLRAADIPISVSESVRITFAGLFASNFLPTTIGGDVIRLAMGLRSGYDKVVMTASLIVDRLVGMAGMGSAALLGLALGGFTPVSDMLSGEATGSRRYELASAAHGGSWGAMLLARGRSIFNRLLEASRLWFRSPKGLVSAFGLTWLHQLCIFGVNWLMLTGLQEDIPLWQVGALWSITYFLTLIPVSINGLGLQELSMTMIFTSFGGVSVASAGATALLVRTLQTLASIPGAAFLPDILAVRQEREKNTRQ